jgi:hypothetical protein
MVARDRPVEAHKAVTSPYTYNEHVFPILRDRCGRCHTDGGVAPMSLLVYTGKNGGAVAWAQSMREMLTAGAMPPWYLDPTGPAVQKMQMLTSRELDVLLTWASGGTPEGDPSRRPSSPPAASPDWTLGQPDLVIPMPQAHTVPASTSEESVEFLLPTHTKETKWVKAADLRAGTTTTVRRAIIGLENGVVLAVWEPGEDRTAAPGGTAFRLPADARVRLQIFYRKPWQTEGREQQDLSSVGLYFTDEPLSGTAIDTFAIEAPKAEVGVARHFGGTMPMAGRILAVWPQLDAAYESLEASALSASGKRIPLLKLFAARPEWPRRYWLADSVELPAGAKIEVTGVPADPDRGPLQKTTSGTLRIAFNFTPKPSL